MSSVSPTSVVARSPRPLTARVDDELVMLDARQSAYFGFDATATAVWELLDGSRPLGEVCADLTERFDVDPGRCVEEVVAFVGRLADEGLVEIRAV